MRILLALAVLLADVAPALAFEVWTPIRQGGLLIGKADVRSKIYYEGKRIKTTNNGRFILGIGRDAPKKITIEEVKWNRVKKEHILRVEQRKWDIQRIDGIEPSKVSPPDSELPRIMREREEILRSKEFSTLLYFPSCFVVPVARARISGVFGSQRILNGEPKKYHAGLDYAAPRGTSVRATAKGKVTFVHEDMYYNGKTIVIDHGFGIFSTYIHLSRTLVKPGDFVRQGENIGMIGSTGRSTGPHLHFEVEWNGVKLDPQAAISNGICR